MVPPSVSAALAPAAYNGQLQLCCLSIHKTTEGGKVLKRLPSSANSIKAKRKTEWGSPQIRQSTTYRQKKNKMGMIIILQGASLAIFI
jgi:hypothetical protein